MVEKSMGDKVRIQHYVPRVYLKNFSIFNGKEHYIWVFDKENDKIFQTNIKEIAFEEEFYDKINEDQVTENILRDIETRFGKAIVSLIDQKDISQLSKEDLEDIAEFITLQMIRTKEDRLSFEQIPKQFLEKFPKLGDKLKAEVDQAMEKESIRKNHNRLIMEARGMFKEIIKGMKWILVINKTTFPYWSSDNPVVEYNSMNHAPYGNLGLTTLGIEIHFPINPKLNLIICDPVSFQSEPNKKVARDFRNIIRERDLQVRYSTRFVFSNENNFNFARSMLKENPELKEPNRERFSVH